MRTDIPVKLRNAKARTALGAGTGHGKNQMRWCAGAGIERDAHELNHLMARSAGQPSFGLVQFDRRRGKAQCQIFLTLMQPGVIAVQFPAGRHARRFVGGQATAAIANPVPDCSVTRRIAGSPVTQAVSQTTLRCGFIVASGSGMVARLTIFAARTMGGGANHVRSAWVIPGSTPDVRSDRPVVLSLSSVCSVTRRCSPAAALAPINQALGFQFLNRLAQ